jgi:hypothetical protein
MYNKNVFRLAACASVLVLAAASSVATAAVEGDSCAARVAGPQGQSGALLGHINADGKCVVSTAAAKAKAAEKVAKDDTGGDGVEASAQCRDLSFSYNKRRNSACAKHGGVLEWLAQQ